MKRVHRMMGCGCRDLPSLPKGGREGEGALPCSPQPPSGLALAS